jgi:hypothetical protein
MTKTKRARPDGSPRLAPTSKTNNINKELIAMLHINSSSGKTAVSHINNKQSPWITERAHHIFGYELSIAKDNSSDPYWRPHPFFSWILTNNADNILLDALAQCCPVFPGIGYKGVPFVYLTPPPSGSINAVAYVVIGHDSIGMLRAVGCNYESTHRNQQPSADFFGGFDLLTRKDDKAEYIKTEACSRMTSNEVGCLEQMQYESRKYGTTPIVLVALDKESGPYFAIDTAVIKPWGSCNSSYEFAGEIL